MTLKECYEIIGGDYDDVLRRLRREALVEKFLLKFLDDPSFDSLCDAFEQNNSEQAFRAAHTIKGVCQNLSFTALLKSAEELTESLRNSEINEKSRELFLATREDYQRMVKAINDFKSAD